MCSHQYEKTNARQIIDLFRALGGVDVPIGAYELWPT